MVVKEILKSKRRGTVTATPGMSVTRAMELLISNKISCLPVLDSEERLIGIVSDKDIFKRVYEDPSGYRNSQVVDLMTSNLIVGLETDDITYIAGIMTTNHIRHVPIVDEDRLIGLVSVGDIVKTQMDSMQVENRYLLEFIEGSYPR